MSMDGMREISSENKDALADELNLHDVQVLIVDDDTDTRELCAFMLQQCGAKVTTAATVKAALSLLAQSLPEVLISDIAMPDTDGYSFMQQVRSLEQCHQIPAIALTAYAAEEDHERTLAAGFQLHLAKPVEPEELAQAVASLLRRE